MFFARAFKKSEIREIACDVTNPDRGFYQIFRIKTGVAADYGVFERCLSEDESLVLLMIDIGGSRNEELSEEYIGQIGEAIQFFKERGKRIILRPVYDCEGNAIHNEPDDFSMVKRHLAQMICIANSHKEGIFIVQGMLLGNWGEMHSSKYMRSSHIKELAEIIAGSMEKDIYAAVRKPSYHRMISSYFVFNNLALFDDAILSSNTDMGTYSSETGNAWDEPWSYQEEIRYINEACRCVPNGGEAVFGESYTDRLTQEEMLEYLRNINLTYLNRLYDSRILDYWKNIRINEKGVWHNKSMYDYVKAHSGYRFVIDSIAGRLKDKSVISFDIGVKNSGFAKCCRKVYMQAVFVENKIVKKIVSPGKISELNPGESKVYCFEEVLLKRPNVKCDVYLRAEDESGARIRFANEETEYGVYAGFVEKYTIGGVN